MTHNSDQQYSRYKAGEDFQEMMRLSWGLLPNWRRRLRDGGGVENPADDVILLNTCNILAEYKSTTGDTFDLSMLREGQREGLIQFEKVLPNRNRGIVFVYFATTGECYAFNFIKALNWMAKNNRQSIPVHVLREKGFPQVYYLPMVEVKGKQCFDVKTLVGVRR